MRTSSLWIWVSSSSCCGNCAIVVLLADRHAHALVLALDAASRSRRAAIALSRSASSPLAVTPPRRAEVHRAALVCAKALLQVSKVALGCRSVLAHGRQVSWLVASCSMVFLLLTRHLQLTSSASFGAGQRVDALTLQAGDLQPRVRPAACRARGSAPRGPRAARAQRPPRPAASRTASAALHCVAASSAAACAVANRASTSADSVSSCAIRARARPGPRRGLALLRLAVDGRHVLDHRPDDPDLQRLEPRTARGRRTGGRDQARAGSNARRWPPPRSS